MARTKFVAGNWKMNLNKAQAIELAKGVAAGAPASGADVGVAAPFVYLDAVGQALAGSNVLLGAQDVYFEKNGAFTGEISTDMLKDLGVKFVLTGHSERRHVLNEPSSLVSKKAKAAYAAGLIVVHCVGEKLEERDAGKTLAVVQQQLEELSTDMQDPSRVVIAYEPVWAIGTGEVATPEDAQEVCTAIRATIAKVHGAEVADSVRVLYGGSVKANNIVGIMAKPDVDGALVGGASLVVDEFSAICRFYDLPAL